MPESGQHPDDQKIGDRSGISFAVSSQWNIHILTEPSAQRYMPSSPEFCHTRRYIRVMEVLQKLKSEHLSKTDRHIRISAEIKINLECIRNTSDPRSHHRIAAQMHRCDLLKNRSCRICKNYLFGKSPHKIHGSLSELGQVHKSVLQLLLNIHIPHDRSCDQLREHRNIKCKIHQLFLRLYLPPIYIDNVGKRLKCIKRNPDRKRQFSVWNIKRKNCIYGFHQKAVIFEKAKKQQVYNHRKNQTVSFFSVIICLFGNIQTAHIVQTNG